MVSKGELFDVLLPNGHEILVESLATGAHSWIPAPAVSSESELESGVVLQRDGSRFRPCETPPEELDDLRRRLRQEWHVEVRPPQPGNYQVVRVDAEKLLVMSWATGLLHRVPKWSVSDPIGGFVEGTTINFNGARWVMFRKPRGTRDDEIWASREQAMLTWSRPVVA